MRTADFDYQLPAESIAQRPAPRGTSRLLVVGAEGAARHRRVADLPELLRAGDLLVVNDTRVIPARLEGRRRLPTGELGGRVEILLLEKIGPRTWEALAKPGKRLRVGGEIELGDPDSKDAAPIAAEIVEVGEEGRRRLRFAEEIEPHLDRLGHVPLPPYIHRPDDAADRDTYQTVFARDPGAVAAPTAGLHFTDALLDELATRGIERAAVTLHVGIGTFRPVGVDEVDSHRMDEERWRVSEETAAAIARTRARGGRIVAVGTTVVRTLESAARVGDGELRAGSGRTDLFIRPGFDFRVVDVLLTNFHLPRSTLLMLVSALAGRERVLTAYEEAVREGYRFYSYGDAMLLERSR